MLCRTDDAEVPESVRILSYSQDRKHIGNVNVTAKSTRQTSKHGLYKDVSQRQISALIVTCKN